MNRYKIELRTDGRIWEAVSVDAPDITALRVEAAKFVGALLTDHASKLWSDEDWRLDATDATGLILFSMQVFVTDSAAAMALKRRT